PIDDVAILGQGEPEMPFRALDPGFRSGQMPRQRGGSASRDGVVELEQAHVTKRDTVGVVGRGEVHQKGEEPPEPADDQEKEETPLLALVRDQEVRIHSSPPSQRHTPMLRTGFLFFASTRPDGAWFGPESRCWSDVPASGSAVLPRHFSKISIRYA